MKSKFFIITNFLRYRVSHCFNLLETANAKQEDKGYTCSNVAASQSGAPPLWSKQRAAGHTQIRPHHPAISWAGLGSGVNRPLSRSMPANQLPHLNLPHCSTTHTHTHIHTYTHKHIYTLKHRVYSGYATYIYYTHKDMHCCTTSVS